MIDTTGISRRLLLRSGVGLLGAATLPTLVGCSDGGPDGNTSPTARANGTTPRSTPSSSEASRLVEAETPYITPAKHFFRIDTADSTPRVSIDDWSLRIHGLVENPVTLRFADLASFPSAERTVTLACVSNEVGGELIGNAVWTGVLLTDLLRDVRPLAQAEQCFTTSADNWTCGFPVEAALDDRGALLATSMNGQPLADEHGFPARLVVPGLYGYVSATKWVTDLEFTTWDAKYGYWTTRGWSSEAPIKPQSRIDVPRRGVGLDAGPIVLGGVAWAPRTGVRRVEIRVDDNPWEAASLDTRSTVDTWRQWYYVWGAEPGTHHVSVRVIDDSGATQTEQESTPDPDGATGWHTRRFTIR